MTKPWLGHENGCSIQWSTWCSCGPEDVDLSETPPGPAWMLPEQTAMPGDRLPPLPPEAYPPDAVELPCELVLDEDERRGD